MNVLAAHISRIVLGTVFLLAGVNGYFVVFELEPFIATSPQAMALLEMDYLLIAEKSIEVICGALLLINRFVPLALAALTPIIGNILLLHLFVDHSLLLLACILSLATAYLLYGYKNHFLRLFDRSAEAFRKSL